jgi:cation:H+ antiporter
MKDGGLLWAAFTFCSLIIVYSGSRLAKYGDVISEKTGLGKTWIGVALMACVTSLPELVTGISSITFADAPDIATGDVLGSCVFNMFILAFLDALYKPMPISTKAGRGHILSAGFGIILLSVTAMGLVLRHYPCRIGWVGATSLLSVLIYLLAMKMIYSHEKREIATFMKEMAVEMKYKDIPLRKAITLYGANALVVIVAAMFLPSIGKGIAESTGLSQTFVGNMLIAASTSLPEIVVSIAAVRIDAVDLAIGNLFGSNIFNIFILFMDDLFFIKGPILSFVSWQHIIPAVSAIAMTATAVAGLIYRAEKKPLFLAWDSLSIMSLYLANHILLYAAR